MIHNIAIKIVDSLSKYGSAQKKRDVYIYGTECFINETIGNFLFISQSKRSDIVPIQYLKSSKVFSLFDKSAIR